MFAAVGQNTAEVSSDPLDEECTQSVRLPLYCHNSFRLQKYEYLISFSDSAPAPHDNRVCVFLSKNEVLYM